MNKYTLSLALLAILADCTEGAKLSRRDLRGRGKSGKSSSPAVATAPSCVAEEPESKSGKGRGGKSKNGGGRGGKGKSSETEESPCPEDYNPTEVTCGSTLTMAYTLNKPLLCPNTAVILDGSEASLDCQGNNIWADPQSAADNTPTTIGVILRNGATLTNCNVSGFEFGAQVREGDNTITDSSFTSNLVGIFLNQPGCDTIQNVDTSYNTRYGVSLKGSACCP